MCNCNQKKGISEVMNIAVRFAKEMRITVIVYSINEKIDFSDSIWFEVHEIAGAKKLYEIKKDGSFEKI